VQLNTPRSGQIVGAPTHDQSIEGDFLDEGIAELMASKYVREALNMPHGIWGDIGPRPTHNGDMLPPAYLWKGTDPTHYSYNDNAVAAYGLEMINDVNPELLPALIAARTTTEGRRDVARIIEGIQPGLYRELRKLPKTPEGFSHGLHLIQSAIRRD
jgi:hypothetical protein